MKIIYKDEILYGEIDIGTVFENWDNEIYIKTNIKENNSEDYLAVNLTTGRQCLFGNEVQIKPLNAELHIIKIRGKR